MSSVLAKAQDKIGRRLQQSRLTNRDFTLFSNDCWGAEVYKYFNLPYNTPFVGVMLMAPCYVRFLQNPRFYLEQPLKFITHSRYTTINQLQAERAVPFPIATLNDEVEIQFLHYDSAEEAQAKWTRRTERINWDNVVVKMDGSKGYATPELARAFEQLPYPRLLLLAEPVPGVAAGVIVPAYTTNGMLLFRRSLAAFDLAGWLNTGNHELKPWQRLYHSFLY